MNKLSDDIENSGFAARLKEERQRIGFSQAVLAQRVGISTPTQIGYEQGSRSPDVGYLNALRDAGVDSIYVQYGVRAKRYASQILDWQLLGNIRGAVHAWCTERGFDIEQGDLVEVERLLYDQFVVDDIVEPLSIDRVLRLVTR